MKVYGYKHKVYNLFANSLKCVCVCVFQQSFSNSLCVHLSNTNTLHGYLYPYIAVLVEGLDRWSEGSSIDNRELERSAWTSKDHPSMSMVEPWSNHIFRAPRRISCILRGYPSIQTTSCCPSQTRRIVDLVNLQTDFGHRLHTDRIQTKYRHKCTNKNEEMYQWLMGKQQEEINQQQVAAMTELKLVGQEQQLFEQFPFFGSEEPPNSVLQLAASLPQLQLQSYPYHLQPMQPNLQESTSAQQNIFGTFKCFNMLIFVDY
ncbi:hypothetical protein HanPSC8_Chr05g0212451 [Helianthus annuus]|nr:hypothetical protein HanPSC8_Chr05g0212451 [Helianthus annuus]